MSAEMLGNAEAAFETTVEYLKQSNSGLIGTFQTLNMKQKCFVN